MTNLREEMPLSSRLPGAGIRFGKIKVHLLLLSGLLVSSVLIPSIPASSNEVSAQGCVENSVWSRTSGGDCVLEHPAESRVLSGIQFAHVIANCPTQFGVGEDGPVYIKFSGVKSDGLLTPEKKYQVEFWFKHDCRDYAGAYDATLSLVDKSGTSIPLKYIKERYYSFTSSRVSPAGRNYCLMYSCGNTYFAFELLVPRDFSVGSASLSVEMITDSTVDKYGFGMVSATFNYPDVFLVTEPPLQTTPLPVKYKNCAAMYKVFSGGIAKSTNSRNRGAKLKFKPEVNSRVFELNKALDRDKDGLVCER